LLKALCENSVAGFPQKKAMVTTMWRDIRSRQSIGDAREKELMEEWGRLPMGSQGSQVLRFEDSFESAWRIVFALIGNDWR
jgi:hypothetical protein